MSKRVIVAILLCLLVNACVTTDPDVRTEAPAPTPTPGFKIELPQTIRDGSGNAFHIFRLETLTIIGNHEAKEGVFLVLIGGIQSADGTYTCFRKADFKLTDDGSEYEMNRGILNSAKDIYHMNYPGSILGVCAGGSVEEEVVPTYLVFEVPQTGENLRLHLGSDTVRVGQMVEILLATPIAYLTPTPVPTFTLAPSATDSPAAMATLTVAGSPTAAAAITGTTTLQTSAIVIHAAVNLRSGPGTNYDIVGTATRGQELVVFGRSADGGWLQVDEAGELWIWAALVELEQDLASIAVAASTTPTRTPTPVPVAGEVVLEVIYSSVNLRSGPGTAYPVLDYLLLGDTVEVIAKTGSGDWFNVRTGGGTRGWLGATVVKFVGNASAGSVPIAVTVPAPPSQPAPPAPSGGGGCCKMCRQGKACGNTCISRSYDCHQPPGCACNAAIDFPPVTSSEPKNLALFGSLTDQSAMCVPVAPRA